MVLDVPGTHEAGETGDLSYLVEAPDRGMPGSRKVDFRRAHHERRVHSGGMCGIQFCNRVREKKKLMLGMPANGNNLFVALGAGLIPNSRVEKRFNASGQVAEASRAKQ